MRKTKQNNGQNQDNSQQNPINTDALNYQISSNKQCKNSLHNHQQSGLCMQYPTSTSTQYNTRKNTQHLTNSHQVKSTNLPKIVPNSHQISSTNASKTTQNTHQNASKKSSKFTQNMPKTHQKLASNPSKTHKYPSKSTKKRIEKFSISPLFILLSAIMVYLNAFTEFIVYIVVVVLHELAHAEVSHRLGYTLSSLRLAPYGASLTGNYEGLKPQDEVAIALAGPAFNLLLAIPAIALWWLFPQSYFVGLVFVNTNLVVATFNILPIFPLDGGRVLLGLLNQRMPRERAYKKLRVAGVVFSLFLSVLFALTFLKKVNISLGITAIFMLISAIIPDKNSYYDRLYSMAYRSERVKNGLVVREVMVSSSASLIRLSRLLNGAYFTRFVVVDDGLRELFTLTETEFETLLCNNSPSDSVQLAYFSGR